MSQKNGVCLENQYDCKFDIDFIQELKTIVDKLFSL